MIRRILFAVGAALRDALRYALDGHGADWSTYSREDWPHDEPFPVDEKYAPGRGVRLLRRIWAALWRRERADDRWWEDGRPVSVVTFAGAFQAVMSRQFAATEWEVSLDLHRQVWGNPYSSRWPRKEITGLSAFL